MSRMSSSYTPLPLIAAWWWWDSICSNFMTCATQKFSRYHFDEGADPKLGTYMLDLGTI
jgi:hypothetical protein